MSDKQETIADIVTEMRDFKCRNLETGEIEECSFIANYLSDRIEAAHKREVEAITAKLEEARHCWKVWSERADELKNNCDEQYAKLKSIGNADIGNAAKMREALSDACYAMFNFLKTQNGGYEEMANALDKAKSALAEPPRNCDVGTAEEQHRRHDAFCDATRKGMSGYHCDDAPRCVFCFSKWAQMPYEEGGKI